MFWIRCTRSGGPCGYATSPLKVNGREVWMFNTRKEAQDRADSLNKTMNGPYAVASYTYVVMSENERLS